MREVEIERLSSFYDDVAITRGEPTARYREHQWVIRRLLADRGFTTCLDAGTGQGRWLPLLERHCDRVVGVDLSSGSLQNAVRRRGARDVLLGDLTRLPIARDSMNLVFSS